VPCVYLLLHRNGDLRNNTVAGRLSVCATCGKFPWEAHTNDYFSVSSPLLGENELKQICLSAFISIRYIFLAVTGFQNAFRLKSHQNCH
jgi:hypothetical protein